MNDLTGFGLVRIANVQRGLVYMEWMQLSDDAREAYETHEANHDVCRAGDRCDVGVALNDVANAFAVLAHDKF